MKYLFLILILIFLFQFPVVAQEQVTFEKYKPTPFISEIEIFGGPSISFLRGNIGVEDSYNRTRKLKVGYAFGLGFNHIINDMFAVNSKFLFERKGGAVEGVTTYYDIESEEYKEGEYREEYIYNYFTLPASIGYGFSRSQNLRVELGVFVSYLHKQTYMVSNYFSGSTLDQDHTEYNSKIDFGLSAAIGYKFPLNSGYALKIQILNTLGLVNTRLNLVEGVMNSNNTSLLVGLVFKR